MTPATVKLRFEYVIIGEEKKGATTVRPSEASLMEQPRTEAEAFARAAAARNAAVREDPLQHRLQAALRQWQLSEDCRQQRKRDKTGLGSEKGLAQQYRTEGGSRSGA